MKLYSVIGHVEGADAAVVHSWCRAWSDDDALDQFRRKLARRFPGRQLAQLACYAAPDSLGLVE
jgi:hypothetical protein